MTFCLQDTLGKQKSKPFTLSSHTPWKVRWVLRLFLPLPDLPLFSPLKSCEEYAVKSFLLQNPLILFAIRTLALKWIPFSNLEQECILKDLLLGRQSEENWDCSLWELCPAELVHRPRRRKQRAKQPGAQKAQICQVSCYWSSALWYYPTLQRCDGAMTCQRSQVYFPGLSLLKTAPTHLSLIVCYITNDFSATYLGFIQWRMFSMGKYLFSILFCQDCQRSIKS